MVENCYSFGDVILLPDVSNWWIGSLIGVVMSGCDANNCLCLRKSFPDIYVASEDGLSVVYESYDYSKNVSNFRGYASTLGSSFKEAPTGVNRNNPILTWESEHKQ